MAGLRDFDHLMGQSLNYLGTFLPEWPLGALKGTCGNTRSSLCCGVARRCEMPRAMPCRQMRITIALLMFRWLFLV